MAPPDVARRAGAGLAVAAVAVAAAVALWQVARPGPPHASVRQPSPTAPANGRHVPARLLIPRLGVDAAVEPLGLDQEHDMDAPKLPDDVGWYEPGPAPGEAGDAVLDGHLDWDRATRAIFADLDQLRAGDEVSVLALDGTRLRFQVTDAHRYPYTAHPAGLFARSGDPALSLITCAGAWDQARQTYLERRVVNARFAGPG